MSKLRKMIFMNNEKEELDKYIELKGKYLHLQIYDILADWDNGEVTYYELSSIIRYDKNLRDTLFKYLALCEEKYRADLCEKYDLEGNNIGLKFDEWRFKLIDRKINDNSNLYYLLYIDFGKLIKLMEQVKLYEIEKINKIKQLKELRNQVMHHNLMIAGKAKNKKDALISIKSLNDLVEILYSLLPDNYKSGFLKDINSLNFDKKNNKNYLDKMCLGELKNGICK